MALMHMAFRELVQDLNRCGLQYDRASNSVRMPTPNAIPNSRPVIPSAWRLSDEAIKCTAACQRIGVLLTTGLHDQLIRQGVRQWPIPLEA